MSLQINWECSFLPTDLVFGCFLVFSQLAHAEEEKVVQPASKVASEAENPSWFEKDKDGVLWFRKGLDGQTKYSSSLVLSAVTDGIVITVTANEKYIDDAVGLAKQMQAVLQKDERTPDHIPIVAWSDEQPGVGYRFYADGIAVDHETLGKKGLYKPSEAKQMLSRVAKYYHILQTEYVPTGEWGKHEEGWEALEIVTAENAEKSKNKK